MIFFTETAEGDNCHVPENDHLFDEGALSAFCGSVNPFHSQKSYLSFSCEGVVNICLAPFQE
jgi:hypothetical protein